MENKNGVKLFCTVLQRIDILKFYRNPGPNPSGIGDQRRCSNFEVQKLFEFESFKPKVFDFRVYGPFFEKSAVISIIVNLKTGKFSHTGKKLVFGQNQSNLNA